MKNEERLESDGGMKDEMKDEEEEIVNGVIDEERAQPDDCIGNWPLLMGSSINGMIVHSLPTGTFDVRNEDDKKKD